MKLADIAAVARNRTTYRAGLLQAKAYRILKARTNDELAHIEKGISSVHWALLGILNDAGKGGIRPQEAAAELGVEAAFVTTLVADILAKEFASTERDPEDNRAKRIVITSKGKRFVARSEKRLRSAMRPLIKGLGLGEISDYLTVLEKIVDNAG